MKTLLSTVLAILLLIAPPVQAGYHGMTVDDVADFEILPGWRTKDGTRMTALRITLAPGWKTYWRAPGEAGIPPRFDWAGSENLASVRFFWPAPDVFEQNGMRSVGYAREPVLPIELTPKRAGQAIALRADVEIGVCEDVCIPVNMRIAADLEGAGASDARIRAALNARPETAREAGAVQVRCRIDAIEDGLRVTASVQMPALGPGEVTVFELPDQTIWIAEAQTSRDGGILTATTEMVPANNRPFSLDRSQVRITVLAAGRGVDLQGCKG
ncbi:putative thio:disulfide interchange protein [Candidatus Rhodobacter oscarellae]|uniref:Putative thio:disulfide interchange protein n=1 Tax=Candidatus Rhodobacter oscarellae TaxID=1675527 RepID=A0A0J9E7Y2_9RHOB|nr:protein-disulfide reductase DsbD domain-containing protein [Candidatus Rhodobacter lobularis]KMW57874.1 putative thio:disulfide interchange protein [Candidatus Rhodobacter lobularis]